jgi:hypothetical protein
VDFTGKFTGKFTCKFTLVETPKLPVNHDRCGYQDGEIEGIRIICHLLKLLGLQAVRRGNGEKRDWQGDG